MQQISTDLEQQPHEPVDLWQARCLLIALRQGIDQHTPSQCEAASYAALKRISALPGEWLDDAREPRPGELTPADAAVLASLVNIRRACAYKTAHHARQLARLNAQLAQLDDQPGPDAPGDAGQDEGPEMSDDEKAAHLLRAALTQLMNRRPGQDDGGRGARLKKPVPVLPGSGQAVDPRAQAGDGVNF